MKRKRGWLLCPLIIAVLLLCAIPAYADIPTMPHAFYGTLTVDGSAAAVGTVVTAEVGDVECGSITTTVEGQYGGSGAFDEKLTVSGEIATGATISFFIGGTPTDQAYDYAFSPGGVTEHNLAAVLPPAPTVSSVSPLDGATDVAVDTVVTATFSEAMDESTITTSSFTLDGVAGSISYDSGTYTATFTPSASLTESTTYTATLSTAITDADGNPLASAYPWSFTTGDFTAPTVTITALSPETTTDNTPTFTGTATDTESNISSVEYKVDDGSWTAATASDGTFDSLSEGYTFTTAELLDGAHTVYVRATDSAANTTAEADYASDSFTVDTTAPTVASTSPADGDTGVEVAIMVTATFSEAMDESTITTGSFTLDGVAGSISYDSGTYTATFTPSADLAYSTTYTATLSTAITDVAGNPLASAYPWSFTTGDFITAPTVSSVSPLDGATDVATYTTVTATFDMAMDESTITASSFTLDSVSGSVSYDSGTYTATFTPDAKLDPSTETYTATYTATLSTAITSAEGIALASAYTWSFTTVLAGDANGDGAVNALDITKVERIIATLDAEMPGADANQDGNINALDITKVERIIVGLD